MATLRISRHDFLAAATQLRKIATRSKLRASEVVFDFDSDQASLSYAGSKNWIAAKCAGRGMVTISGLALETLALGAQQPGEPEIEISISDGMLRLGRQAVSCRWTQTPTPTLLLPVNASLADILALRHMHSQAEIEAAGFAPALAAAEDRKAQLVNRAADVLSPIGVTPTELDQFLTAKIKESVSSHAK